MARTMTDKKFPVLSMIQNIVQYIIIIIITIIMYAIIHTGSDEARVGQDNGRENVQLPVLSAVI